MKLAWAMCLLVLLSGCSSAVKPTAKATTASSPSPSASSPAEGVINIPDEYPDPPITITPKPGHIAVRSTVRRYALIATDTLPRIEPGTNTSEKMWDCDGWGLITPATAGGKAARALGWRVTGEQPLGSLTAVTILRHYYSMPGVPCMPATINIVFYEGDAVVAMLHPARGFWWLVPDGLQPMKGGALRVATSLPAPPIGDLTLSGNVLRLDETAPFDTVCDGHVRFPNLFHKPIEEARAILLQGGWRPYRPNGPIDRERNSHEYVTYYREGITEIDTCAVDSVGQCLFYYRSPRGVLRLMTGQINGEYGDRVIDYGLQCRDRAGKLARAPWR
ncbi:hypothetical protein U1769_00010 [Sphingomonas sp. ZT3P38]|uniref:hypothetical protein n=1 Tax=Parasphingomonas zepuensis TaxID=3096161 RepID=UPI002FC5E49D